MKARSWAATLLSGEALVAVAALAVVMWGGAVWTFAIPGPADRFGALKGTDFAQFYVAARFAAAGRLNALYDWSTFAADLSRAVPHSQGLLYLSVYPPQLAILLGPLARFDYLPALAIWTAVSAGLYALSIAAVVRADPILRAQRRAIVLLAIAFPAFQQALLHGQIGTLALALVALGCWAWQRGHWWLAGFALGSLVFKPQMGAIALCAFLVAPGWRLVAGLACGTLAQAAGVLALAGAAPIVGYWDATTRVLAAPQKFEPKLWQMHSLRGAFELVTGHTTLTTVLWIGSVVAVLWLVWRVHRRIDERRLQYAAAVIAGLLINPHLYVYDLVVLAVPLCLIASWFVDSRLNVGLPNVGRTSRSAFDRSVPMTAFALFWAPLVGPFAAVTHVQLTSPLLVFLLWQIVWLSAAASTPSTADR
jgi:hypothetical protein